ncbi:succinate dehydrogenase, hydrophobic membrane anchor protein [Rhodobacterales bacterium HKCCE3408]|nr:succinate dehydrogenase, hydrophobic membrane anchor protein [Rhodobacterales bacterium HKCCE3408]
MAFMTDRKRVTGLGASHTGTGAFWTMTVTSVALLILTPLFVFIFGPLLGEPHAEVIATLSRPFPAIVTGLMIVVGLYHFRLGVRVMIEDYAHGFAREAWIIVMTIASYALMAAGLFAVAKIAL